MSKITTCKHCGAQIAKSAKVCPHCGGKNKKPIFKRVWFWILIAVLLFPMIPTGNSGKPAQQEKIEYTAVTVDEMYADLSDNALNAEEKYSDAYVAVTGKLAVIDSDGNYIGLTELNEDWSLNDVQCYITNDEQLEKVKGLSKGDTVTVKGKIKNVGEVLGFSLNIDSIE